MTPEDFDRLQTLLASRAGVRLTRDRMHLAEHRLGPVARREGYHNVEAMLATLWNKPVASLGWSVIEALLNSETWFRRDRAPFESFSRELLPALGRARPGGLVRVWSAGCGSGQEAYSLAMDALDARAQVEITATQDQLGERGVQTIHPLQRGSWIHSHQQLPPFAQIVGTTSHRKP